MKKKTTTLSIGFLKKKTAIKESAIPARCELNIQSKMTGLVINNITLCLQKITISNE